MYPSHANGLRILYWIDHLNRSMGLNIGLSKLAYVHDLSTFGNSRFLLKFKTDSLPLVLKSNHNDGAWKERYFLMKLDSILGGNILPQSWFKRVEFLIFILRIPIFTLLILFDYKFPPRIDSHETSSLIVKPFTIHMVFTLFLSPKHGLFIKLMSKGIPS